MLTFDAVSTYIIASLLSGMPTLSHPIEDYECMAHAIYHESSNQEVIGMIAVGHLLKTRMKDKRFKNDICGNVLQPAQFDYVTKGRLHLEIQNSIDYRVFRTSFKLAVHILEGHLPDPTNGADHFYNPSDVNPNWASVSYDRRKIQDHLFVKVDW